MHESKASDVWACGVALFTMLTQTDPFSASTAAGAAAAAASPRPLPGASQTRGYSWPPDKLPSAPCQDLVEQMLQPVSDKRITAEQIKHHPWFLQDLPTELQARTQYLE
jgi:serine/threonine-protein kinase SRK2